MKTLTGPELALAAGLAGRIAEAFVHLTGALELFSREFEGGAQWFVIERAGTAGTAPGVRFLVKPTEGAQELMAALQALSLHEDGVELAAGPQEALELLRGVVKAHAGSEANFSGAVNAGKKEQVVA